MDIKDFHDTSWCMALKRLHDEMLQENEFMNEVSHYHLLTEEDLNNMEKEHIHATEKEINRE